MKNVLVASSILALGFLPQCNASTPNTQEQDRYSADPYKAQGILKRMDAGTAKYTPCIPPSVDYSKIQPEDQTLFSNPVPYHVISSDIPTISSRVSHSDPNLILEYGDIPYSMQSCPYWTVSSQLNPITTSTAEPEEIVATVQVPEGDILAKLEGFKEPDPRDGRAPHDSE